MKKYHDGYIEYGIGDRVIWSWIGNDRRYEGIGTVISEKEMWQPGLSSPAARYIVENDEKLPFPFIDIENKAEFGEPTNLSQWKFIYGALKPA